MMAKRERKREREVTFCIQKVRDGSCLGERWAGHLKEAVLQSLLCLPLHCTCLEDLEEASYSCTALHCACKGPGGSHALPHPTSPCIVLYMFRTWIRHPAALLCSSTALCCLNCCALPELLHCTCKGPAVRLQCDKPLLHQCQLKSPLIRPTLSWIVNGKWHKTCLTSAQIYLDIWIEVKQIYSQSTLILSKVPLMDDF